jgi:predicted transposase YbfD/YdcC
MGSPLFFLGLDHWRIENSLRWLRDVVMNEDQMCNRKGRRETRYLTLSRLGKMSQHQTAIARSLQ